MSQRVDKEVLEAFELFDKDSDGKVTKEEIVDLIKSLEGDPNCQHLQVRNLRISRTVAVVMFLTVLGVEES